MTRFAHRFAVSRILRSLAALAVGATLFAAAGCEESDSFDHEPPAGQGALIVDNNGELNVAVFIDGIDYGKVFDGHWEAFDLPPGVHRLVMDEINGDRSFAGDVDILEGRQTILDVRVGVGNELVVFSSLDD